MHVLTARSSRIREVRKLQAGKHRRERGQFLAEGPKAVREALLSGMALEVFVTEDAERRWHDELGRAYVAELPIHRADPSAIDELTTSQTPQGLVALCRWTPPSLAEVLAGPADGQVALAHEMSDPGNAGALIRVADAAGARAVALSDRCVDPTNPKSVRASAGSVFHLPVVAAGDTRTAIVTMRSAGWRLLATDATPDAIDLFGAERDGLLDGPVAWVFGNEAHGLPEEVRHAVDHVVRIPILGQAESLNLATAAAVCLYAYARRRELR